MRVFLLAFMTFGLSAQANITDQFHDYLFKIDSSNKNNDYTSLSFDRIKYFVNAGADVNARSTSGANAIHLVIEGWSYIYENQQMDATFLKSAKYLLDMGSNPSLYDYRGHTSIWYLHNFKEPSEARSEMIEVLLNSGIDLNAYSKENDGDAFVHRLAKSRGSYDDFEKYINAGLDLTIEDNHGQNIAHYAAYRKLKNYEKETYLSYLLKKLPLATQKNMVIKKSKQEMTPLHIASMSNNLEAVKFLVETYRVPLSPVSKNDKTPLNLAKEVGATSVVNYLLEQGAIEFRRDETINCRKRNTFKVTYKKVKEVIEKCRIKKINKLLSILPSEYLSNYILSYFTHAVQGASKEYPHVTTFGHDAKFLMAFNGHKEQRGFRNLEIIEFLDKTNTFEMRDIEFPKNRLGKVKFSEKNPTKCIGCHGQKPRPLWDNWTFWPGKYGSEIDELGPTELDSYKKFSKHRNKGRYKNLPPVSIEPLYTPITINYPPFGQNSKMDTLIYPLISQKIAQEIVTDPKLKIYKYLFLASVTCKESIESFAPKSLVSSFKISYESLLEDTKLKGRREVKNRLSLLENLLGIESPQSRYVYQQKLDSKGELYTAGRNFAPEATAKLRYLAENLQHDISDWFAPYNNGFESYMNDTFASSLAEILWQRVLKDEGNTALKSLYSQKGFSDSNELCNMLKSIY